MAEESGKTEREGERIVGSSRRPDGTLRKPFRIRPGYTPPDEVPVYQSKGTLLKKEKESQVSPPGYEPETETKSKRKSAKRKEKKQQAALEKPANSEQERVGRKEGIQHAQDVESVASQVRQLALSTSNDVGNSSLNSTDGLNTDNTGVDIDKKIRALKKKIRLAEAQLQKAPLQEMKPDQLDKAKKLEGWREELTLLEAENTTKLTAS